MITLRPEELEPAARDLAGIPEEELSPAAVATAFHQLREELVGQDERFAELQAVLTERLVSREHAFARFVETLTPPSDRSPLLCVLAIGPTGTGKSETARRLADLFCGGRMVTLQGPDVGPEAPHNVSMWVGAPPGYVGYNQGGTLTNALRAARRQVILIDDLHRASPAAIQDVLMPLLHEGLVTDRSDGRTLSAAECLVFATANPGGALAAELLARFHFVATYSELDVAARLAIWRREAARLSATWREGCPVVLSPAAERWLEQALAADSRGARGVIEQARRLLSPLLARQPAGVPLRLDSREGAPALVRVG